MSGGAEQGRRRRGRPRKLGAYKAFSCRLPEPLYAALRHLAVDQGKSLNDLVVEGLMEFWGKQPSQYVRLLNELTKAARRR